MELLIIFVIISLITKSLEKKVKNTSSSGQPKKTYAKKEVRERKEKSYWENAEDLVGLFSSRLKDMQKDSNKQDLVKSEGKNKTLDNRNTLSKEKYKESYNYKNKSKNKRIDKLEEITVLEGNENFDEEFQRLYPNEDFYAKEFESFDGEKIIQGIIFSEIINKPISMRRQRGE